MTLRVTDTLITSNITEHLAAQRDSGGWKVTWLPDRRLEQEQAVAAMELAEIVAKGRDGGPDTTNYAYLTWRRVMELADILGVIPLKTVLSLEEQNPDPER